MIPCRLQILADGDHLDRVRAHVAHHGENLLVRLTQPYHQPGFSRNFRKSHFELAEQPQRMRVVRSGPRDPVQSRHRLEVVIHYIGWRFSQNLQGTLEAPAKIRHQDFDLRSGRSLAHRANTIDEVLRAAVAQVIAIHAGDDDVGELQCSDRLREIDRLLGVERQRTSVADVAEGAAPRANVAHDHERGGAFAEAFADVRTRGFLAHRVQAVLTQNLFDLVEARTGRRPHADPVRLAQRRRGDHLDRNARCLRATLVLDASGVRERVV